MHRLYQVFDTISQQAMGPILKAHHEAAAIREFTTVLADKGTLLGQHPADFQLLEIGKQHGETGEITPVKPKVVLTGAQWLAINTSGATSENP